MITVKCLRIGISGLVSAGLVVAAGEADRVHKSTARSDPERFAEIDEKAFRIDGNAITSPEWQAAITRALSHQSGRGYYTLMRVLVDDAAAGENIQAQGTKLKDLTERYDGGGGEFQIVPSGGFLFLEHINSARRRNGRDPVILGSLSHSKSTLWVDEPPAGVLGVLGDVILRRCPTEEMGSLAVKFEAPLRVSATRLTIGPVVVGGPYGDTHPVDTGREFQLPLPPGAYKILLPDFDVQASRWDVAIQPRQVTHLTFKVSWQVTKTQETRAPFVRQPDAQSHPQEHTAEQRSNLRNPTLPNHTSEDIRRPADGSPKSSK